MTAYKAVWRVLVAGLALLAILTAGSLQSAHAGWVYDGIDSQSDGGDGTSSHGGRYERKGDVDAFQVAVVRALAHDGDPPAVPQYGAQTSSAEATAAITHRWYYDASSNPTDPESFKVTVNWRLSGGVRSPFGQVSASSKVLIQGNAVDSETVSYYGYSRVPSPSSFSRDGTAQLTIARIWGSNTADLSVSVESSAGGRDGYNLSSGTSADYYAEASASIGVIPNPF